MLCYVYVMYMLCYVYVMYMLCYVYVMYKFCYEHDSLFRVATTPLTEHAACLPHHQSAIQDEPRDA